MMMNCVVFCKILIFGCHHCYNTYATKITCKNNVPNNITIQILETIKDEDMFVENFTKGFQQELKEAKIEGKNEGKKETFFDGLFLALSIKFDEITEKLKQQFLALKPKNFDLTSYKNIILTSKTAEEAYAKIAKLAAS